MMTFPTEAMKTIWIAWISLVLLLPQTTAEEMPQTEIQSEHFERELLERLMMGYNKAIRPTKNRSDIIIVTFGVSLTQVISLVISEEKTQILTTNCWLNHNWIDNKLIWNPAEYSNITSLLIPIDNIWKPDILLYNNADLEYYHKMMSTNAIVQFNGNVTWLTATIIRSTCEIDVRFFPFDVQNCSLKFASWTYSGHELDLVLLMEAGDLSNFVPSCEWDLKTFTAKKAVRFYSCCAEPYPDITISLLIRRRPLFYVFNYLVPCGGAAMLAFMGFFTPGESGEKFSLGITTLLSLTLFLLNIGEVMPPTASVPLIELYYGTTMLLVAFATAVQTWTLNIHFRGTRGEKVPSWIRRMFLCKSTRVLRIPENRNITRISRTPDPDLELSDHNYVKDLRGGITRKSRRGIPINEALENPHPTPAKIWVRRVSALMQTILWEMEKQEQRSKKKIAGQEDVHEWRQLAQVVDKLLLTLFLTTTACLTIAMFLSVPEISMD